MNDAEAWRGYWEQTGDRGGCLPGASDDVRKAFEDTWVDFGQLLDSGSAVLDLACGTGAVLRAIQSGNSSIAGKGIDFAAPADAVSTGQISLQQGDIEDLPFEPASFDAITSQFGIEYADHGKAIAEAARVAKPGAKLQFVIHHRESPIARQNLRRLSALTAIDRAGVIEINRKCVANGENATIPLRKALLPVAAIFPDQSVVEEIGAALHYAANIGDEEAESENERIQKGIDREITTLTALNAAIFDDAAIEKFTGQLSPHFDCAAPAILSVAGNDLPLGWLVTGNRAN